MCLHHKQVTFTTLLVAPNLRLEKLDCRHLLCRVVAHGRRLFLNRRPWPGHCNGGFHAASRRAPSACSRGGSQSGLHRWGSRLLCSLQRGGEPHWISPHWDSRCMAPRCAGKPALVHLAATRDGSVSLLQRPGPRGRVRSTTAHSSAARGCAISPKRSHPRAALAGNRALLSHRGKVHVAHGWHPPSLDVGHLLG